MMLRWFRDDLDIFRSDFWMNKGLFSHDWSLLNFARTWKLRDIRFEDGQKEKERMPPFMEPAEIIESTLLLAGVETERQEGEAELIIRVNLDAHHLFGYLIFTANSGFTFFYRNSVPPCSKVMT